MRWYANFFERSEWRLAARNSFVIATLTTVLVFGILLLAGGVVQIVNAFLARNWGGFFLHLLAGLLLGAIFTVPESNLAAANPGLDLSPETVKKLDEKFPSCPGKTVGK